MIFPLVSGKLLLAGGLVNCTCCTPEVPPPVDPMLDILMATATSAGGSLGCAMGPVVKTFDVAPPYELVAGDYELRVDFTTGDSQFHVGSYYELELTFTPATALISWETSATGTVGDPWTITNGGKTVRYSVEDSWDCGGTNEEVQTGTALATITVSETTSMGFDFTGLAELQSTGFENIAFYLRSL